MSERGSVSVVVVGVLAVGMIWAGLTVGLARVSRSSGRVQAAADAAALAAAQELLVSPTRSPARVAAAYARRNGARLLTCHCPAGASEVVVTVAAEIPAPGGPRTARRSARAMVEKGEGWVGLDPGFAARLACLFARVPAVIIVSGFRTRAEQARLHAEKPGLAAPPGRSRHEVGLAADLGFATADVRSAAHAAAPICGLGFPVPHEPWHVEPT